MGKVLRREFVGIDSWNRPVFKDVDEEAYYGDTNHLFPLDVRKWQVVRFYKDKPLHEYLVHFGKFYGCEPSGESIKDEIAISITGMDVVAEHLQLFKLSWAYCYSPKVNTIVLADLKAAQEYYEKKKKDIVRGGWLSLTILEENEEHVIVTGARIKYDEV